MKFFNMYKVEQKLSFRSPDVIVFNLAMPCVTFLLIFPMADDIFQSLDIPIYPFFDGLKIPTPSVVGED